MKNSYSVEQTVENLLEPRSLESTAEFALDLQREITRRFPNQSCQVDTVFSPRWDSIYFMVFIGRSGLHLVHPFSEENRIHPITVIEAANRIEREVLGE